MSSGELNFDEFIVQEKQSTREWDLGSPPATV